MANEDSELMQVRLEAVHIGGFSAEQLRRFELKDEEDKSSLSSEVFFDEDISLRDDTLTVAEHVRANIGHLKTFVEKKQYQVDEATSVYTRTTGAALSGSSVPSQILHPVLYRSAGGYFNIVNWGIFSKDVERLLRKHDRLPSFVENWSKTPKWQVPFRDMNETQFSQELTYIAAGSLFGSEMTLHRRHEVLCVVRGALANKKGYKGYADTEWIDGPERVSFEFKTHSTFPPVSNVPWYRQNNGLAQSVVTYFGSQNRQGKGVHLCLSPTALVAIYRDRDGNLKMAEGYDRRPIALSESMLNRLIWWMVWLSCVAEEEPEKNRTEPAPFMAVEEKRLKYRPTEEQPSKRPRSEAGESQKTVKVVSEGGMKGEGRKRGKREEEEKGEGESAKEEENVLMPVLEAVKPEPWMAG